MSSSELFSRERLAGYDPECLATSVALVVGAGALGQNTAQNLALAGVGEIRIVDRDLFEDHNQTRSPAYPLPEEKARYGLSKARAVAHKLKRLMTAPRPVMRYAHQWIQQLGDGAFRDASVVVCCVDTPTGRAYLSDKSRLHGIALVEGGFNGSQISLSCYPAAEGEKAQTAPCWQCANQDLMGAFSCRFYASLAEEAGIIPAIQNAASTLAGLQAEAAILAIHGQLVGASEFMAFDLNLRTLKTQSIKLATDPLCPGLHRSLPEPPLRLETSSEDTVGRLLQEITDRLNRAATLKLDPPLIWTAPCARCGAMTFVSNRDWLWMMNPHCESCGGSYSVIDSETSGRSATIYVELSLESDTHVLRSTCREIGLPSMSLIEAQTDGGQSKNFELAGNLNEIFESGDNDDHQWN